MKARASKFAFGAGIALSVSLLTGCFEAPESDSSGSTVTQEEESSISAPSVAMNTPPSLSGVVAAAKPSAKATLDGERAPSMAAVASCEDYFDPNSGADWMNDGYEMSKFLVGLSQQLSCRADLIMGNVLVEAGSLFANKGLITLPVDPVETGAPSHLVITESAGTYSVWLYFATAGEPLPADLSTTMAMYLSWSTSGTDTYGQFIFANLAVPVDNLGNPDNGAPRNVRVDFERLSTGATNDVYLGFGDSHPFAMNGFHIQVKQIGSDPVTASFEARGLIDVAGQPMGGLPTPLDETTYYSAPTLGLIAISDAAGSGAAKSRFVDFAQHYAFDINSDQLDDELGTYENTMVSTSYFTVDSTTEYMRWSVERATYVETTSTRLDLVSLDAIYEPLLGTSYFTNNCAVTGNNCVDFVGEVIANAPGQVGTTEPADGRSTTLSAVDFLSMVWPQGLDAITAFDYPSH